MCSCRLFPRHRGVKSLPLSSSLLLFIKQKSRAGRQQLALSSPRLVRAAPPMAPRRVQLRALRQCPVRTAPSPARGWRESSSTMPPHSARTPRMKRTALWHARA
nr:unnamed protein product [Digitaria exilis]